MSLLSKLVGIWVLNRTVSSTTPLFLRLLVGIAAIAVCAIVATIIVSILLMGGVWLAYHQLIASGLDPSPAALITAGGLLALLAALIVTAKNHFIQIRTMSRRIVNMHGGKGKIGQLLDAFLDGYEGRN